MGKQRRRDVILKYLHEQSEALLTKNPQQEPAGIDATQVAEALGLDRANVSKELNALYQDGLLLKRQGKPTRFLDKQVLSVAYPNRFIPSTLLQGQTIADSEAPDVRGEPFFSADAFSLDSFVGAKESLRSCVEQAMAAVTYPPHGLHTLITGSIGIGKSRFAQLMYSYFKSRSASGDPPFIIYQCQDVYGSIQLAAAQLFGCSGGGLPGVERSRRGMVDMASGGILLLNDIHKLPPRLHESVITLLEKNTYTRVGEAHVTRKGNLTVIATSSEAPESAAISRLAHSFPVHIRLPDLDQRSPSEVLEHLLLFFSQEADATGIPMRVHKDMLICLVQANYAGQIGQMKSRVKGICSRAYWEHISHRSSSSMIDISCQDLPHDMLVEIHGGLVPSPELEEVLRKFDGTYVFFAPGHPVTLPEEKVPEEQVQPLPNGLNMAEVDNYILRCMTRPHTSGEESPQVQEMLALLTGVLSNYQETEVVARNSFLLYGEALHLSKAVAAVSAGKYIPSLQKEEVKRDYPQQYATAGILMDTIEGMTGVRLPSEERNFAAVYLFLAERWISTPPVRILLLCHGDGVAQAMAAYVNEQLGQPETAGLSFGKETSLEEFMPVVSARAKELDAGSGILIFADMPPLTDIQGYVRRTAGVKVETVSGTDLPIILRLARLALNQNLSLSSLIQAITSEGHPQTAIPATSSSEFLNRIIDETLSSTLVFLNPRKAAETLLTVLHSLLEALNLPYSDEIAIKFVFHCAHMVERIIRGDFLKYPGFKRFLSEHQELIRLLEQKMSYLGETFGIFIPDCELAYVAEIFIPFLQEKKEVVT